MSDLILPADLARINYDTGLPADGECSRKRFDDAVVQREVQIIASDLHATAVRVSGDDPQRLARAGQHALAAGLELWFSPVPINLEPGALPGYFARCAREAERLRRAAEGRVVLVAGCDISLWCAGFLPGGGSVLASYGVVAVLEQERGTTYPDMAWEPKQVSGALAGART